MTKKELPKLIPFGIASFLVLMHGVEMLLKPDYVNEDGETVYYRVIDSVQYAGLGLLIVLALILLKKPVWKYVFSVLTILALTPLINFFNYTLVLGIGIIQFEATALGLLMLHFAFNPDVFSAFKSLFKPNEETEEERTNRFEQSVHRFEIKFQKKSKEQLESIVAENFLVPEAIEAAKRLLQVK